MLDCVLASHYSPMRCSHARLDGLHAPRSYAVLDAGLYRPRPASSLDSVVR